jgi:indolepyruvate ferredoxin oxidoreductase
MALAAVSLDDRYALERGTVLLSGTQALVRLPMLQKRRDEAAALATACYVSGYRGSPLGGLDRALWQAREFVERHAIHFQPGVNEDLAATACWGSQQTALYPDARVDGVFALWYGKGPGVDRSGDAFKHANFAGTSAHGGVLALAGDDHLCLSSTQPHQSEFAFVDAMMPVLHPANVQEILDYGLAGWAMSRFCGAWVGLKLVADTVETTARVEIDPHRLALAPPTDYTLPPGGLNIRWPDPSVEQERRLHEHKLDAARAFARANGLDRMVLDAPNPRLGIVATGKSWLDLLQALDELGLDEADAQALGLRLYKVGMSWPLEPEGARAFAAGLEEILVVEEKRPLIESQLKELLYDGAGPRPRILGKRNENGAWLLPSAGELSPTAIALALASRLDAAAVPERLRTRIAALQESARAAESRSPVVVRQPYFCSGCPHNSSTKIPEDSKALAGIGCHYMVQWMDRDTQTYTHMGAEGANWNGLAPFVETGHVFQNIGDGTYYHSGLLAVRAAVGAGVNVTYKILYNDAVAMTGGQPMDGPMDVPMITRQLHGEGVKRITVVSDEPAKYSMAADFAKGVTIHHRDALDEVQRELRDWPGVSALIYDQTCATEKRRRRKRGLMPNPARRVVINPDVCEGCGDCSRASNCLSVIPLETDFGRKRAVDLASCNKDESCLDGFCPSFVVVKGGSLRKADPTGAAIPPLPEPERLTAATPVNIIIAGVGGTGVVTLSALLGMAAHLEGLGVTLLDHTGLAQKYGAVVSYVRLAAEQTALHAPRIAVGGADLLLGGDLVVAASKESLTRIAAGRTAALVNAQASMVGDFAREGDYTLPETALIAAIEDAAGASALDVIDATGLAAALTGDAIGANLLLLGAAYQRGRLPVSGQAIETAIKLNGVAVEANLAAFRWGRLAGHDPQAAARAAGLTPNAAPAQSLEDAIEARAADLAAYQNQALAERYRALVRLTAKLERERAPRAEGLADAVSRGYHKLLAVKDEYEVARLYTDGRFARRLAETFEGKVSLEFRLAPPILGARDTRTGHLKKRAFGPWVMPLFRVLARLKSLRGTPLDIFGYSPERKRERAMISEYEATVATLLNGLTLDNHVLAVEIASLPLAVKGFGHIKDAAAGCADERRAALMTAWRDPPAHADAAE